MALLVLGLGNVLCGDDGLGVVAVHRLLRAYRAPADARVLDGGTLGLALLSLLEDARDVILVDAVRTDAPPGSLVRLTGDAVGSAVRERLSVHQVGVADLLDALRLRDRYPERLLLLGLVPTRIEVGFGLSPPAESGLPALLAAIVEEAGRLGYEFEAHETRLDRDRASAAGALGL